MRITGSVRRLILVLGDQLDLEAAVLRDMDQKQDGVLMMEVAEEATHVPSHRQRITLFLAAMRHFALELFNKGVRVQYVRLDDPHNTQSFDTEVRRHVGRIKPESVHCIHPGEYRVLDMMETWQCDLDVPVTIHQDDHFLTGLNDFHDWLNGRKELILEHFYRRQRKSLGILITADGKPVGGSWNFDKDNRKTFRSTPRPPVPYQARPDPITKEVMQLVEHRYPDAPGSMEAFHWPVTRAEALRALNRFVKDRLAKFGTYQDALWTGETSLYHSRLSSSLNLKLLRPMECVNAAVAAYESGAAPLNSVEGFIRQIIGWREFIRCIYWHQGRGYACRNALRADGRLPEMYWTGRTDMTCMRESLAQVLSESYGHHIQRLMITGNFALIGGVHPKAISHWYLGMYVDAVEWVTLPNTLGMAMHADGGVVGTKPYAASGKYIDRMSNYCAHCRFDVNQRTGESACPFNTLYWDFLIRHHQQLSENRRMTLILKNVQRMNDQERTEITVAGRKLRRQFGIVD